MYETAFVWVKGDKSGTIYYDLSQDVPKNLKEAGIK